MKRHKTPKEMPLGDIGFNMKVEAGRIKGDVIPVRRDLWLEIAERLMETDQKCRVIERMVKDIMAKDLLKKGLEDDRRKSVTETDKFIHGRCEESE